MEEPETFRPVPPTNGSDVTHGGDEDEHDESDAYCIGQRTSLEAANGSPTSSCVQVAVRVRPLLAWERRDHCIQLWPGRHSLQIGGRHGPRFTFDSVFGQDSLADAPAAQAHLFNSAVVPLLQACWQGYNATILAYGQTGSGKTHTILGSTATITIPKDSDANGRNHTDRNQQQHHSDAGILPRAVNMLFEKVETLRLQQQQQKQSSDSNNGVTRTEIMIQLQFLELYGEEIRDLLIPMTSNPQKLTVRDYGQDDPEVVGATRHTVSSASQALQLVQQGLLRRVTAATAMNQTSSRSHAMLTLYIEQQTVDQSGTNGGDSTAEPDSVIRSKFNFVDLAGSERQKRTQATGKRLKEGIDINKGLLVLGNVISALGDPSKRGKTFVPYRDSKLTRLLQGSLGGNHRTLMIACVSPSIDNMEESLNCLRYANRAKNIQNNAVVNVDARTKAIQVLQHQVKVLAGELLQAHYGDTGSSCTTFTKEVLQALASGAAGNGVTGSKMTAANGDLNGSYQALGIDTSLSAHVPYTPSNSTPTTTGLTLDTSANSTKQSTKLQEVERELVKTQRELEQSRKYHEAAEEQLYSTKAKKELYELRLSAQRRDNGGDNWLDIRDKAFIDKATDYEAEIGRLKQELHEANRRRVVNDDILDSGSIQQAKLALERDRQRLALMQAQLQDNDTKTSHFSADDNGENWHEAEEEEEEIDELAKKYISGNEYNDDEDENDDAENFKIDEQDHIEDDDEDMVKKQQSRHLQADLVELSRSIAAKEDLIDQLRTSQEKFANMREFYEEKLRQMEENLAEKESEREQLIVELRRLKSDDHHASSSLKERLREKEDHIANLRKRQRELLDLTSVSSRNDTEISKLQSDVKSMKKKKADMQKQLNDERKSHNVEVKQLKKTAMQKEREITKYKRISTQREREAKNASQIAKSRLDELGKLRSKYKDAEKRLRVMSVKRGVMAKAGLDPVLVGRRNNSSIQQSDRLNNKSNNNSNKSSIDADAIRKYFDVKVAKVAKKEVLVEKLAQEWEEHFELTTRRDDVIETSDEESDLELQALNVQIQFKEDRIRQLAQRIGKQEANDGALVEKQDDSFLFDSDFIKLCKGNSSVHAKEYASRVLFGMIVRERRRIAALARTASSLDEKAQEASRSAEESEAALRSYMDEQRHQLATITQTQQEQILSLMEMVKQESGLDLTTTDLVHDTKLLILANERANALEQQLSAIQSEADAAATYRTRIEDLASSLKLTAKDNERIQAELDDARATLRRVYGMYSRLLDDVDENSEEHLQMLEVLKSIMRSPTKNDGNGSTSLVQVSHGRKLSYLSPRSGHLDILNRSDSIDDFDEIDVDWANDIMADLALIAEGKIPPSLATSPPFGEGISDSNHEKNVFERLTDPENFTGIQKQARMKRQGKGRRGKRSKSPLNGAHEERRALSREIASQLDKIVIPGLDDNEGVQRSSSGGINNDTPSGDSADSKSQKSVFERLVSPSHFTGTQKERHQHKPKITKSPTYVDNADRLLDDLLQSDSDHVSLKNDKERSKGSIQSSSDQNRSRRTQSEGITSISNVHDPDDSDNTMFPDHYDSRINFRSNVATDSQQDTGTDTEVEEEYSNRDTVSLPNYPSQYRDNYMPEPQSTSSYTDDYTSVNVFERLTKTTTEAYAKKSNRWKREYRQDPRGLFQAFDG